MLYKNNQRGIIKKRNYEENGYCALYFESLPETCIPSYKSFGHRVTKLVPAKEIRTPTPLLPIPPTKVILIFRIVRRHNKMTPKGIHITHSLVFRK